MFLKIRVNENTRRMVFEDSKSTAAIVGDSNVDGVIFYLPENSEYFEFRNAVIYVVFFDTTNTSHKQVLDQIDDYSGMPKWTFDDNVLKNDVTSQVPFFLHMVMSDTSGKVLKSWNTLPSAFIVYKNRDYNNQEEEAIRETDIDRLAGLVTTLTEKAKTIGDVEKVLASITGSAPKPVDKKAKMIDDGHIYLYTGDETNFVTGALYYYVDGTLTYGGIYGSYDLDNTLTEEGKAADAKAVGDKIAEIKEDLIRELKNTFTVPTTYTFIANASYWTIGGGVKPSTGANQTSDKQCRTAYNTIKGRTLLYIDNPNYNFVVWEYTADNVGSAIYSPSPAFGSNPVIIADDMGATKFRVGVLRKDLADMTSDDISVLTSAVKTFLLTDDTLTIKGSPADGKIVGDSINAIQQQIEQIPVIPQPFPSDGKKADAVSFYESFNELAEWQTITGNQFFEYGVVSGGYVDNHITEYQKYALRAYYLNGRMEYIGYNGAGQNTTTNYYKLLSPYTDDPNAEAAGTSLYSRKKVLIVAGMHGDEGATPNILREFVRELINNPDYADILTSYQFCFIPLANPYGYSLDRRDCRYYNATTGQIETKDMNGDFPQDGTAQVLNESKFIKQIFLDGKYDIVFDLHQHNFDTNADTTTHKLAFGGVTLKAQTAINADRYCRVIAGGAIHAQNTIRGMFNIDEDAQTMFAWNRDTTHTNTFREYAVGTRDTSARHKAEMAAISETSTCCFIYSNTHTKYNQLAMTVCKEYDTAFIVRILRKFIEE